MRVERELRECGKHGLPLLSIYGEGYMIGRNRWMKGEKRQSAIDETEREWKREREINEGEI